MKIDWNEAPEWAIGWAENPYGETSWVGEHGYSYVMGGAFREFGMDRTFSRDHFNSFEPRPTTWTGEGQPPVGTVCEIETISKTWVKVIVVAETGYRIYCEEFDSVEPGEYSPIKKYARFRPIRTPEQIAAEERLASAYAMCNIAPSLCNGDAVALYDAGYRKQVKP